MMMHPCDNKELIAEYSKNLCKCSKCGSKATFAYYYLTDKPLVRCTNFKECNNSTGLGFTPEEVIEKWNREN